MRENKNQTIGTSAQREAQKPALLLEEDGDSDLAAPLKRDRAYWTKSGLRTNPSKFIYTRFRKESYVVTHETSWTTDFPTCRKRHRSRKAVRTDIIVDNNTGSHSRMKMRARCKYARMGNAYAL